MRVNLPGSALSPFFGSPESRVFRLCHDGGLDALLWGNGDRLSNVAGHQQAGGILESQAPLEALQKSLKSTPARTYDRWRGEAPAR